MRQKKSATRILIVYRFKKIFPAAYLRKDSRYTNLRMSLIVLSSVFAVFELKLRSERPESRARLLIPNDYLSVPE